MIIFYKFMSAALMAGLISILGAGCSNSPGPIDRIELYQVYDPQAVPSGGPLSNPKINPMPTTVWDFPAGVKLYVGLRLNESLKKDVTFTKFTILNPATSSEYEVGLPKELGPYEPGQITLLNYGDPWTLPSEKALYQFRIYQGDRIVSIALVSVTD
jgi:hypothetical protein